MAKMYIMGKYSEKAFLGFLKDPTTDRKAAVEKLTSAAGGKMLSMDIVRGPYDFIVVAEMANFETFALSSSYVSLLFLPVIGLSYMSAVLFPFPWSIWMSKAL